MIVTKHIIDEHDTALLQISHLIHHFIFTLYSVCDLSSTSAPNLV